MPSSWYMQEIEREVTSEQELKVAAWREENTSWEWDQERFDELQAEAGDLGAPTIYMPRMNVQSLYIDKMGVEAGVFAILDWPDTVEACFDDTFPLQTLIDCSHKVLDLFAPKLMLGISGEISSTGDLERVRLVGDLVAEYNAKCAA